MAGIYLHIPFCRQACTYCNFHFTTSLHYKDEVLKSLEKEAITEKDYFSGEQVNTIYFGGGTPSLLSINECNALLQVIRNHYPVADDAEITLEANPDDITNDKLAGWKDTGINRLSIGVQSFFEEELKWMNRAHNAKEAFDNLSLARKVFDNITMDLIYGSPLLTDEMWKQNVDHATDLDIPHLSCYALTVEEKTPLFKMIRSDGSMDVNSDKQARQFTMLMQWLREKGYQHYEVSNFAKPGYRSRHNSSYWNGENYLGLGPSAHSYNGKERRWNAANNNIYIQQSLTGNFKREAEILTPLQKLNEYIMISLRTSEGMNLEEVEKYWGPATRKEIENGLEQFMDKGLTERNLSVVRLTDEGMLLADGIASELFFTGIDSSVDKAWSNP